MATRVDTALRSFPRNRARIPERADLDVGVDGRMLDATVDKLEVSGVILELVPVAVPRGLFNAERAGGGGRRVCEREGEREGVGERDWNWDEGRE